MLEHVVGKIMPTTDPPLDTITTKKLEETSATKIASATTGAVNQLASSTSNPC